MFDRETSLIGFANYLANNNWLSRDIALQLQQQAEAEQLPLISYLVKNNIFTGDQLAEHFKTVFALEIFDLNQLDSNWLTESPLNVKFIRQYRLIPLKKTQHTLQLATANPTDQQGIEAAAFQTGLQIHLMLVTENQLAQFIDLYCHSGETNKNLQPNLLKQIDSDNAERIIQENIIPYDEPLIHFVNNIILHAIQKKSSDIHIEPFAAICRVRFRLQGVLHSVDEMPLPLAIRVITRIKVMAHLNITERRLPQDGRFQFQTVDVRVSTCPTLFGEKIVLRLLNASQHSLAIDHLNFSAPQKELFVKNITKPQGLVLVTGPTGSGKTSTLYTALNHLNNNEKNILTVEDPIEIRLHGVNQVNVNSKIGLDFSTVLRAFLRQDPDIIMVGEIRDLETAEIAIQAAQTGHLVLSTLHTNSAIETITRLHAMGISAYNLVNSLALIIAQRLIRKLCTHCKTQNSHTGHYHPAGCPQCAQGYSERIALYEFLPLTDALAKLIYMQADTPTLLAHAKQNEFITLQEAALNFVTEGITSTAEIHRVLQ